MAAWTSSSPGSASASANSSEAGTPVYRITGEPPMDGGYRTAVVFHALMRPTFFASTGSISEKSARAGSGSRW